MLYKITNLLSTSITVEDLGIILPARGSCSVHADAWARSNDARDAEARRWVRADKQFVDGKPSPPVHPVRPAPVVASPAPIPPVPTVEAPPPSRVDTPVVSAVPVSQESFDRFLKNQEELMQMMTKLAGAVPEKFDQINKSIQSMPAPAVVPYRPGMIQSHEISPAARGAEPIFVPSKIVPEDANASIKVKEGEAETDVAANADALKKMRKKS